MPAEVMQIELVRLSDSTSDTNLANPNADAILDAEKSTSIIEVPVERDPFGDERNAIVKYKTMSWWQAGIIMIAETISLGILALPKALSILGLLPGVLAIICIGILSTYTGSVIGQLKCRYPHIHSMADAGDILMGRLGREIFATAQLIFFIFIMGSHILTFSMMMNVLTEHSSCTILFSFIGTIVSFALTLPRRLENLSYVSLISFISIIGAVLVTMAGVSPMQEGPQNVALLSPPPSFTDACVAISNIVFAYAGHVAFFTVFSELRDITEYPKALALLQMTEIILYTLTAVVIYAFVGPDIASPAVNSARKLLKKIAYGIAIPTIVIGGVVNAHVAVKYFYVRIFRGTNAMHNRSLLANGTWALICAVLWLVSWMIAEAVPVFNDVLGLASSLFASWFSFVLCGIFWLHLNRNRWSNGWEQRIQLGINCLVIVVGLTVFFVGAASSVASIHRNSKNGVNGGSFSCADNS